MNPFLYELRQHLPRDRLSIACVMRGRQETESKCPSVIFRSENCKRSVPGEFISILIEAIETQVINSIANRNELSARTDIEAK